jgi:hypothetical protein
MIFTEPLAPYCHLAQIAGIAHARTGSLDDTLSDGCMPPSQCGCPNMGDNVQAWAADDLEDDDLNYMQVIPCHIRERPVRHANKEARGHRGSSPLSGPFFSGVGLARSAFTSSRASGSGAAFFSPQAHPLQDQQGEFVRRKSTKSNETYVAFRPVRHHRPGPGRCTRCSGHEHAHRQTYCLCSLVVPRAQTVQVAVPLPSDAPGGSRFPKSFTTHAEVIARAQVEVFFDKKRPNCSNVGQFALQPRGSDPGLGLTGQSNPQGARHRSHSLCERFHLLESAHS